MSKDLWAWIKSWFVDENGLYNWKNIAIVLIIFVVLGWLL